jgi:hypothetical protein
MWPLSHVRGRKLTFWASAYTLWLRRREQYQAAIRSQTQRRTIAEVIAQTARREPVQMSSITASPRPA